MKKSLVVMALLGSCAAAAQAQSNVTIYGTVDSGLNKATGSTLAVGKRDNNKLGFKGVEDLGGGLSALFQLEIRYEPDTGAIENTTTTTSRPLFQGQSRVGLQGSFGTLRFGRGLSAYQETTIAFEPWSGMPTPAGFMTDLQVAGYTSDPLSAVGNSRNRFANAAFYNSPLYAGMFQVNVTYGTKEANGNPVIVGRGTALDPQFPANSPAAEAPYSVSATFFNGPLGLMAAYEKNGVETDIWSVGASYKPINGLKLMATYQRQDQDYSVPFNPITRAWVIGANYNVGVGKVLAGFGHKSPDGVTMTRQYSLGYEYNLSVRTYLYADASTRHADTHVNYYSVGIHHNF